MQPLVQKKRLQTEGCDRREKQNANLTLDSILSEKGSSNVARDAASSKELKSGR
jgi:hypothetical protein